MPATKFVQHQEDFLRNGCLCLLYEWTKLVGTCSNERLMISANLDSTDGFVFWRQVRKQMWAPITGHIVRSVNRRDDSVSLCGTGDEGRIGWLRDGFRIGHRCLFEHTVTEHLRKAAGIFWVRCSGIYLEAGFQSCGQWKITKEGFRS